VLSINATGDLMECKYIVDGIVEKDVPLSRVKLSSHHRDPIGSGFLSFVDDLVGRITALIPPRSDMRTQLKTAIDLALLKQMVENNAMNASDLVGLLSTLVSFITKLQSPHRSSEFIEWFNPFAMYCHSQSNVDDALIYIPKFFEITSERLEQIQLEAANYYLAGLASYAAAEGPEVFKKSVNSKINELVLKEFPATAQPVVVEDYYTKYLPRTTSFLCKQLTEPLPNIVTYLKDMQAMDSSEECSELSALASGDSIPMVHSALVARAFSLLLQQNVDLNSPEGGQLLPETFLWDGERLRNLKNEIDSLVLVTTLLISCRSYLISVKKRLSTEQEIALQDMLYEVLRDDTVSLIGVVTTAQNFVRKNCNDSTTSGAVLPDGWEVALEESLKKCVTQTSPVFMLFSKRVHSVVTKAIMDVPFTDMLGRFSMNSRPQIQQLKLIISAARGLFVHNSKTFGDVYSAIFRKHFK
jgi:hypothetical protein